MIGAKEFRMIRRAESISSEELLNNIINRCDSQRTISQQKIKEIQKKSQEMVSEVKRIVLKRKPKMKFYDENYIANAVKMFRDEKKAFIYASGRYVSGCMSSGRLII